MKILYAKIDIDGVLADLHDPWLRRYRRKWKHKLYKKDITDWNMHQFTIPACGKKIYDIAKNPKIYDVVKPIPDALEGVQALRNIGFTIIYVTACYEGQAGRKFGWLKEHGFWNETDHYVESNSKQLIIGDLLIDDSYENVINSNCYSLLFAQPWNEKYTYGKKVKDWREIIDNINYFKEWQNAKNNIDRR